MKSNRTKIENMLEELADNQYTAKQSINIAVDFLMGDLAWLKDTISSSDKHQLIDLVAVLTMKEPT